MRQLQKNLIRIMVLAIIIAILVPESIYMYWFAVVQRNRVTAIFANNAYDAISTEFFDNFWNTEVYVESLAYSVSTDDMEISDYADAEKLDHHMDYFYRISEQLVFGIDNFVAAEYYINPELTSEKTAVYRPLLNDAEKTGEYFGSERLDYSAAKLHLDMALENVDPNGEGKWIEPYHDDATNTDYIAFVEGVYTADGELISIVGATYNLNDLMVDVDMLTENDKDGIRYTFCDPNGAQISGATVPEISEKDIQNIIANHMDTDTFRCDTNDGLYTIYPYELRNGYYVLAYQKNMTLYSEHYNLLFALVIASLVILVVFVKILTKIIKRAFKWAMSDNMTKAYNNNAYLDEVQYINGLISEDKIESLAIVVFDINGLKKVNDTLGHAAGDALIVSAYNLICESFFANKVYRIGGDEFAYIGVGMSQDEAAISIEMLYKRMREQDGVNISAGYGVFDKSTDHSFADVFARADAMMYEHKREYHEVEG